MELFACTAGKQVRPRPAGQPADQRETRYQKQKGGGVEGHLVPVILFWIIVANPKRDDVAIS